MRDIRTISRRLVAALLLLVAAAHAAAPIGQPFERFAGSAFSAATGDVSLACGQPAAATKRVLPIDPAMPVAMPSPTAFCVALPPVGDVPLVGLGQTGPPATRTSFSPLAPRAPPAA